MMTDDQLAAYCSGGLSQADLARFERALADDEPALRAVLDQERMDAALRVFAGPRSTRANVARSILEVISSASHDRLTDGVMRDLRAYATHDPEMDRDPHRNRPSVHWRRLAWGGGMAAAAAVVVMAAIMAGGKWFDRSGQTGERTGLMAGRPAGDVPPRPPSSRDLTEWPFAADSPWNTPIGSQARFTEVQGGLDLAAGIHVFDAGAVHQLFVARPGDPMRDVYLGDEPQPAATLAIPAAAPFDWGAPETLHIVAPDGVTLHELINARYDDAGRLRAAGVARTDLRGSGVPPDFVSGHRSRMSRLAGSLWRRELDSGVHRAIGAVVPIEAISLRPDGEAHVWPAVRTPRSPDYRARLHPVGNVHLGTLLAIPPGIDLAALGVGTTGPAYEIARALQDYGVYVKDAVDLHPAGSAGLVVCVALDASRPLPDSLDVQLRRVAAELKVVVNNGPNTMGGGGTPRRPPAPQFKSDSPR